jgi:transposase-like protein
VKKRIRHGDPERRRYWEEMVRRCRDSGQSVRAFCRAEGLRESAFYFWRRKLTQGGRAKAESGSLPQAPAVQSAKPVLARQNPKPSFLPVHLVGPASGCPGVAETAHGVEIILGPGCTVRVQAGFDRQTLADVLAVLEVQSC